MNERSSRHELDQGRTHAFNILSVDLGLGVVVRDELDKRREDCRRMALKILETRLGDQNFAVSTMHRVQRNFPTRATGSKYQ